MEQKDPVLERNFLIFMVLTIALIFGWMYVFGKYNAKKKPVDATPAGQTQQGSTATAQPPAVLPAPAGAAPGATEAAAPLQPARALPAAPAVPAKSVLVRGPLYAIDFSGRGAAAVSWRLNKYLDKVYYPVEISLKWPPVKKLAKFTPVPIDLVDPSLRDKPPLRSRIVVNNLAVPDDAVWQTGAKEIDVSKGPAELVFTLPLRGGGTLKKIYTFYPDSYRAGLRIEYSGARIDPGQSQVDLGMNYVVQPMNRLTQINFHGPMFHTKGLTRVKLKDLDKQFKDIQKDPNVKPAAGIGDNVDWTGFTDSYFLTAVLAPKDAPMTFRSYFSGDPAALERKDADKEYRLDASFRPSPAMAEKGLLADLELYFGPKEKDVLQKIRPTLALAIDYGWFAPIAIPMMYALKWVDKLVGNFGWSIVILTIIMRMAMFPLTRKSQQSMKELQKLQPEMEKIRKKFPNDRTKQQEEIYALQRKYKINPLGGCLPMLVQIPIFFAFYKVLMVSIELRQAPWVGWITDLSVRDPLLILPLVMGLSQFVMQKLTPTAGADPTQAKMMQFLPLVFTVLMVYFPAGLLLYWTVSNIIGIGQQLFVNYLDQPPKTA